jgi:predicted enzyme related to lactoylglutathione lyase
VIRQGKSSTLYPSWIEIPAADLQRAVTFYRAVFGLEDIAFYDEPPMQIAVLLPSDKDHRLPGVSLVQSPSHRPGDAGPQVNFHVDTFAAFDIALAAVREYGGVMDTAIVDMGDGVRYITVLDSEGNRIAISSYEPVEGEDCALE